MAMEKKQRAAAESGVLLLVVAGILIAVNALSALGGYKRIDTTKTERYTLSKGSGNLVHTLKQNMQVDAYVARGLPKLDAFVRDLRDLLQEYKDASGGHFDYRLIEAKDEDQKKEAKEAGIQEQQMGEASATEDEKGAVTQGYMGLVFKYGSEKDVIPSLSPDHSDGLEFWITNKLREIRDKADNNKHKVGVLTGHDEIKLTESNLVPGAGGPKGKGPSVQDIVANNFKFYEFVPVDLKGGESAIDENLDGLIITQPGKDLNEKELRRIDQFVMKGKSLAVIASSVNVKNSDATMNATLNAHGLDKLLDGYGVELRKDVVLDFSHAFTVLVPTESGIARLAFPQFLHITDDSRFTGNEALLDTGFPAFFRLEELMFPFVSSLVLHKDKQPDAKTMKVVARSSPYAFTRDDRHGRPQAIPALEAQGREAGAVQRRRHGRRNAHERLSVRRQDGRRCPRQERAARTHLRALGEPVPREPLRPRWRGTGHVEVRHAADGRRRQRAPRARAALPVEDGADGDDPVVQGHARLADRRHRPARSIGEAPLGAEPHLRHRQAQVRSE